MAFDFRNYTKIISDVSQFHSDSVARATTVQMKRVSEFFVFVRWIKWSSVFMLVSLFPFLCEYFACWKIFIFSHKYLF